MIGALTNHLWQSSLFAVAAALLTLAFRRNKAQVRYWLWFAASVKFLIPFAVLLAAASNIEWTPATQQAVMQITAPAGLPEIVQIYEPFQASIPPAADSTPRILLGLWAGGFAAVLLMRLRGWLRVRSIVRVSTAIDLGTPVEVRSAPGLLEPGVVGWLRPVLLLPSGIENHLTAPQLEAVLAHELCHVRRRDNLFASIHMAVEAALWFHPLVWWIGARLVEERERACDETVLGLGNEPRVYADGILNVCKLYIESPLACVSGVSGADLRKRIEAIMRNRIADTMNTSKKVALAGAGLAVIALPLTIGVANSAKAQNAKDEGVPRFEVSSVKPCEPARPQPGPGGGKNAGGGQTAGPPRGRLDLSCRDLYGIVEIAYVGEPRMPWYLAPIANGPDWIKTDRYKIEGIAEGNPPFRVIHGVMLQRLLADRFRLKVHRETRETPLYALTVAPGGAKLQASNKDDCTVIDPVNPPAAPPERICGAVWFGRNGADGTFDKLQGNLNDLVNGLSIILNAPVVDRTGITGTFDFHLEYAPDENTPGYVVPQPGQPLPSAPSVFSAVREQLGLRLESTKGPWEFLIIDSAERPMEN